MDDRTLMLLSSSGGGCCLVFALVAAYLLSKKNDGGGGGTGPGNSNAPGTPLPVPANSKGTAPWYVVSMTNPQNFAWESGALRVNYVSGKWASDSGAGFHANPWKVLPKESCTLSYDVYLPPNFKFNKGGKLPGVCIGVSERDCSTGGRWSADGGSARVMFRENGVAIGYLYLALGDPDSAAKAQTAAYRQVLVTTHAGHELWKKQAALKFVPGKWNNVSLRVVLNTPGKTDGSFSLTVNGVTKTVPVMWRKTSKSKITNVDVVSFFGGGSSDWAAPPGMWSRLANFKFAAS